MAQYINKKWSDYQYVNNYEDTLKNLQQIIIETTLNNRYVYRRYCINSEEDIQENQWNVIKNGIPVTDTSGNELVKTITNLREILTEFFNKVDPVTNKPIEIPTKCIIR